MIEAIWATPADAKKGHDHDAYIRDDEYPYSEPLQVSSDTSTYKGRVSVTWIPPYIQLLHERPGFDKILSTRRRNVLFDGATETMQTQKPFMPHARITHTYSLAPSRMITEVVDAGFVRLRMVKRRRQDTSGGLTYVVHL